MEEKKKVWIYHNNKFRQVDEVKVTYPVNVMKERIAKFITRSWETLEYGKVVKKENWDYVPFGKTKEECLERVNFYTNLNIENYEKEIAKLKLQLIKLD